MHYDSSTGLEEGLEECYVAAACWPCIINGCECEHHDYGGATRSSSGSYRTLSDY